jgi:hypothetical protein
MYAAHHKVDNLIAAVDYNGQQIDGPTRVVMNLGDLGAKYKAFGWDVIDLPRATDMDEVVETLDLAKTRTGKGVPVLILLHTEMGYGVDFMMGSHKWHGVAPTTTSSRRPSRNCPSATCWTSWWRRRNDLDLLDEGMTSTHCLDPDVQDEEMTAIIGRGIRWGCGCWPIFL